MMNEIKKRAKYNNNKGICGNAICNDQNNVSHHDASYYFFSNFYGISSTAKYKIVVVVA